MEVMRKFIIDLKPNGTMKWAEVCDEPSPDVTAYNRIIEHCETMLFLNPDNADKVDAYTDVMTVCRYLRSIR